MKTRILFAAGIAVMILLSACGNATPTDTGDTGPEATEGPDEPVNSDTPIATQAPVKPGQDMESGPARIDSINILMLESFPVQINVVLKGNLPDGCTQIGTIDQLYDAASKTFTLNVSTTRPGDMMCTEALVPFEKSVPLAGVVGLAKGTYTVNANGMTGTFELTMDNGPVPAP